MRLDALFEVKNGLPSTKVTVFPIRENGCVPFLRPSSTQNRTVAGWVKREAIKTGHIFPIGTLFVSTNGEGSHSFAYVSQFEFAANSDVSMLIPKRPMTVQEKVYYARCITMNRFRFSYGRKPKGERLKSLELPDSVPSWVSVVDTAGTCSSKLAELAARSVSPPACAPQAIGSQIVNVRDLFDVIYGTDMEMVRMTPCEDGINFVSRTSKNNGVVARVAIVPDVAPTPGGVLSVAGGGSVLETFVQMEPFYSGRDLFVLKPREPMSTEELLFYATCIRANMFRFNYGRQANRTLKDLKIPARASIPAWAYGSLDRIASEISLMVEHCGA